MMELLSFSLFPLRALRLNDRTIACQMAEDGADLLEVSEFYRQKGQSDLQAIRNASRIFRGTNLRGGAPFTKDIAYLKGFLQVYNFINSALKENKSEWIPFLFAGKSIPEDIPVLYNYHLQGVVDFPKYLPTQFQTQNSRFIASTFMTFKRRLKFESATKKKAA